MDSRPPSGQSRLRAGLAANQGLRLDCRRLRRDVVEESHLSFGIWLKNRSIFQPNPISVINGKKIPRYFNRLCKITFSQRISNISSQFFERILFKLPHFYIRFFCPATHFFNEFNKRLSALMLCKLRLRDTGKSPIFKISIVSFPNNRHLCNGGYSNSCYIKYVEV